MHDGHDAPGESRKPYPWTEGWDPLLTVAQVTSARCDNCDGPAKYAVFTEFGDDTKVQIVCDCTEEDPFSYEIILAELADEVEGPDWAQHLPSKDWWRSGRSALRARMSPRHSNGLGSS